MVDAPEPLRHLTIPPPFSNLAARVDARIATTGDGDDVVPASDDDIELDRPVDIEVARARATAPPPLGAPAPPSDFADGAEVSEVIEVDVSEGELEELEPEPSPDPPARSQSPSSSSPRPPKLPPIPAKAIPPLPPAPALAARMPRAPTPPPIAPEATVERRSFPRFPTGDLPDAEPSEWMAVPLGSPARAWTEAEPEPLPAADSQQAAAEPEIAEEPRQPPPLEAQLAAPSILEQALDEEMDPEGRDAALEHKAQQMLQALEACDDSEVATLAYELGELCERHLADEAGAMKAFARALAADPAHSANRWAIRRVFYRRGLWPNLIKLIEGELRLTEDPVAQAELWFERGRVLGQRLGEPAEARAAFELAAALDPKHQGALLELERIGHIDRDHTLLQYVWTQLAEAAGDPTRRCLYLLDVSRAQANAGEIDWALQTLHRARALAVEPERVLLEWARLAEVGDRGDELAQALAAHVAYLEQRLAASASSAKAIADVVAMRRRQAQVAVAAGKPEEAWESLQAAHRLSPAEPILVVDLMELAEALGRFGDLAALVQTWQSLGGDAAQGVALTFRRADALLRSGQREEARAILDAVDPATRGHVAFVALRESDAIASGDPAALAAALTACGDAHRTGSVFGGGGHEGVAGATGAEPAAAVFAYVAAAEVWAFSVGGERGHNEAEAALAAALAISPDAPHALATLVDVRLAAGRADEAIAVLASQVEVGAKDAQQLALERLAQLHRSRGAYDSAIDAIRRLASLTGDPQTELAWRLEGLLGLAGRDEERGHQLTEIIERDPDPDRRLAAIASAARLWERLGDTDRSVDLYRQLLAGDPDNRFALVALVDLLRGKGRWRELVDALRALADSVGDNAGDDAAWTRAMGEAAWVAEVRLGDASGANRGWHSILDRNPGDGTALEGMVRTAATPEAKVEALRQLVETVGPVSARQVRFELATQLEQIGRSDDAIEVYRSLWMDSPPDWIAAAAALALWEHGVARGDLDLRVEAAQRLVGLGMPHRFAAALIEDAGWSAALAHEDLDRATELFEQAVQLDPKRVASQLGAALVAAKRGDPGAMATAYAMLAERTELPELAGILHLRCWALHTAVGSKPQAMRHLAAAAAGDDAAALVIAVDAQPTGPDQAGPDRADSEMLAMRGDLADPANRVDWDLEQAETLEAAGRLREAGALVVDVLRAEPKHPHALEAMRRLAIRGGDAPRAASAAYHLACVLADTQTRAELLRECLSIADHSHPDPDLARAAYRRLLACDPGAIEISRYAEILRANHDTGGLFGLLSDRLRWLEASGSTPEAAIPYLLERATLLFAAGDVAAADADLSQLLFMSPDHGEALRFRAELCHQRGDVSSAVEMWRRYVDVETRPDRRAEVELTLTRVLEEESGDLVGAVAHLARLLADNFDDSALHERMVALATRAGDWPRVATSLQMLAGKRSTGAEAARDELRLAAVLVEKVGDRRRARNALERARAADPLNIEIVRGLLSLVEAPVRAPLLAETAETIRNAISANPTHAPPYERLASVAEWQGDAVLQWMALVAVDALGTTSAGQRTQIAQAAAYGKSQAAGPRNVALTSEERRLLTGGSHGGLPDEVLKVSEIWRSLAPGVAAALGLEPGKLGFARGDRIPLRKLSDKYPVAAALCGQVGMADAEVFISENRFGAARVVSADPAVLCLGADIARGDYGVARFSLARCVYAAGEGVGPLLELRDVELLWMWAAALTLVGQPIPESFSSALKSASDGSIDDRARSLERSWKSRDRKAFAAASSPKAYDANALLAFRFHVGNCANRFGLLAVGDLSIGLDYLDVGRGGRAVVDHPIALSLLAWAVGGDHLELRRRVSGRPGGHLP